MLRIAPGCKESRLLSATYRCGFVNSVQAYQAVPADMIGGAIRSIRRHPKYPVKPLILDLAKQ